MTNRSDLIALYIANKAAQEKVARNASKLAWIDATRQMGDMVASYASDLARYRAEASDAAGRFAAACEGMGAEAIASIIIDAEAETERRRLPLATEPTPQGNQYVIPGCEKDRTRGPAQGDLF